MKTMTCSQLGEACAKTFQADSFEKIAKMSKLHSMAMFHQQDAKKKEFDALAED